jgi:hypothetical protein
MIDLMVVDLSWCGTSDRLQSQTNNNKNNQTRRNPDHNQDPDRDQERGGILLLHLLLVGTLNRPPFNHHDKLQ